MLTDGDAWWVRLLRDQQAAGFPDAAGTDVSATLPVSDRLLTRAVRELLPQGAPVRALDLRAHAGNRLTVRVRLARPSFLPAFTFPIEIARQPEFPHSPVLVLRVGSPAGLGGLAAPVVRFFDVLPPGLTLQRDRLSIDLQVLADAHGAGVALPFVQHLEITTAEGQVIVRIRAGVTPPHGVSSLP